MFRKKSYRYLLIFILVMILTWCAGAQVSVDIIKSEKSDVDKGPFIHVSSSGFVAAEDLQFSSSEITGMPQDELVTQYLTLFAFIRGVSVDVDGFYPIIGIEGTHRSLWVQMLTTKCGVHIGKIRRGKRRRGGRRI
jgi:hypothetical protein